MKPLKKFNRNIEKFELYELISSITEENNLKVIIIKVMNI